MVQGDEAGLATITERELPWEGGGGSQGSVVSSEPRVESVSEKTDGHLGQMLFIYQVGRGEQIDHAFSNWQVMVTLTRTIFCQVMGVKS